MINIRPSKRRYVGSLSIQIHRKLVFSVHQKLGPDVLAVSLHSCVAADYGSKELTIDTEPVPMQTFEGVSDTVAMSLGSLTLSMLHEACFWECKTENRMIFKHGTFPESSPPALIQKVEQS